MTARAVAPLRKMAGKGSRTPFVVITGLILLAAVILRLASLAVPHVYFPDEIFQYLEAAHRLVFGPAVIPWEYREHIRSWLLPLLLAGPMWLGGGVDPAGGAYLVLPKLLMLVLSLGAVVAGAILGRRISPLHLLFAMLTAATWVEFILFATVALTEPLAAVIFLLGAAILYRHPAPGRAALITAGALLTASCIIRFQYGPAVLAFGLMAISRGPFEWARARRECCWLLAGALPPLLFSALVDFGMGERPFSWILSNIHQNITLKRSHAWVDGPFYYPEVIFAAWGIWFAPLLGLALIGARRYPALFVAAVVNVLVHSAIAHKEYRYILLTNMTLILLAAIGTADAIQWVQQRQPGRWKNLPIIAAVAWLAASASIASTVPIRYWWSQQSAPLRAFAWIRETPRYCGVAIFGFDWTGSGGYAYLHRPVPLFWYGPAEQAELRQDSSQFNALVVPETVRIPKFTRDRCWAGTQGGGVCILNRPGHCAKASSPNEINRKLIRIDR